MRFSKTPLAVAALALCGALPLETAAQSLPAPTSGSLDVWFKAPLSGATVSGNLELANCYVRGSGISRVQFYLDSTLLNTDSNVADGMSCTLDTRRFSNGTHRLRAVAYSSSGSSRIDDISIRINNPVNAAPSVSFTSPTASQTVSGSMAYAANASDDGGVSRVDFFLDSATAALVSDTGAPYGGTLDTTKLANGAHSLRAVAYDAQGLSRTSQVAFNVQNSTAGSGSTGTDAPSSGSLDVWFKAPASGSTVSGVLNGGTSCWVRGSGITRVQFYLDNTALNTDTSMADGMQCVLDTTKFANGSHQLKAQAFDSSGRSRWDVVTVNVQNTVPNAAPTVSLTSPGSGQTVSGTAVPLTATASDDAGVTKVDFFVGTTLIASDTTNSYGTTLDTTKLANGSHVVKAVAYDAKGLSATSQVSINVQNTVTPTPTATDAPSSGSLDVWFKAPVSGSTIKGVLNGGTSCWVRGSGVTRVQFFLDNTALNTDTTMSDGMQCQLDTTKFANGTHQLKAVAYSSSGASRMDVVNVNIQNTATPSPTPSPTPTPTPPPTSSLPSTGTKAVPTFESLGLYWSPGTSPGSAGCQVQFRAAGETAWRQGLPMWYDSRNAECRGSLVHLQPGTSYEVQFALPGQTWSRGLVAKTWSEAFPIAKTVHVSSRSTQLNITEGGTPEGYVLYTPAPGTAATIDVNNAADYNVNISAPYVIVRGFTLKGARVDAVRLSPGAHDVVVEDNDITHWGRSRGGSLGVDQDSAVRALCTSTWRLERVVVQNNKIHDPRYGSNSWSSGHPAGPQAISFWECGGQHVFRYNEIWSSTGKYYNDAIGAGENFSGRGFPYADTDVYGNRISHAYDDGIEAEGANRNVRIWGNYVDDTFVGIASTATHSGPFYVFRNVFNRGGTFGKSGMAGGYGGGRRYFFHNTLLGSSAGIKGNTNQPLTNAVTRNNVLHLSSGGGMALGVISGSENDFNYDLSNGGMTPYSGAERNGIVGTPTYASGHGVGASGLYQLAPGSRGYDQAVRIPNFNDDYLGNGPDMGANETGAPAMKFGNR